MSYRPAPSVFMLCFCAVSLHAIGVTICSTVAPDINPTPPLVFPSDELNVKIVQATEASTNKSTKSEILYLGNNNKITTKRPTSQLKGDIFRRHDDEILMRPSQPFNVKISENYTENYIENKYYNNHVEESWATALTLSLILIIAFIVLGCSAFCMNKIQNLKTSNRQLLLEVFDESVLSDLVHV